MNYFISYTILFITLLLISCTQEDINSSDSQTPVVDAYLYAGQSIDSFVVSLTYSYAREDTNLITINDLDITVTDGEQSFTLIPKGNGLYQNKDRIIENEKVYQMSFEYNGNLVSAQTFIPQKRTAKISKESIRMEQISDFPRGGVTFPEPVEISWENPEGDYYYVTIENLAENPEYVNEFLVNNNFPISRFRRITEPEITDFYSIDPRREIEQFGLHRIIIFRVNPEYAALYEVAGTSSVSITQPPTNVENGLGIFTGVSSDTLYLEVEKI